jgi:hypothetical protein
MASPNKSYIVKEPFRNSEEKKIDYSLAYSKKNSTKFYDQPALQTTLYTHVIKSRHASTLSQSSQ